MSSFDVAGETAVITGGASGIGLAAARALGRAGARIVLADYNETNLEKSYTDLEQEGIKSYALQLEVTDVAQVEAASKKIEKDVGPVSILLNSAGIAMLHSAIEIDPKDWLRVINVNLNGTFWPSRVFGACMIREGRGSIINMGSMSGTIVNHPQFASSYMASKGAVHQLTKALAVEWAKTGVRVNAIAPGYIATEMTLSMRDQPELFNRWMEMTPMGRCGTPEEIGDIAVFLASKASSYMTGSILAADGGYTCL